MFAHIVGANCNSPILQITHIPNASPFQICPHFKFAMLQFTLIPNRLHVTICPHSKFTHVTIRPMLLRVFFPQITHVPNHPCSKLLPLQIAHITIHPCYKLPPLQFALCCCVRFFLKFVHISNSPPFQIALRIKNSKKVFYYKNKFVSLPP